MFFSEIPPELLAFGSSIRLYNDGWYQLLAVVPGERVPTWLHVGGTYRGYLGATSDAVTLYAPDSELTAVVSASLVERVLPPDA
jgi:hypothetical protein